MADEIQERRRSAPLLPLQEQRDEWRGKDEGRTYLSQARAHGVPNAISARPITHLVVVLEKADKTMAARLTDRAAVGPTAKLRILAIVNVSLPQRLGQVGYRPEVSIDALTLAS